MIAKLANLVRGWVAGRPPPALASEPEEVAVKKILSLGKYLALLPQVEPLIHDAYTVVEAVQAGTLDDAAVQAAAADLGSRLLKIVGWVQSHGTSTAS